MKRRLPSIMVFFFLLALATTSFGQILHFEYTQEDAETGFGALTGSVDGVAYFAELPPAVVLQNDLSELDIPEGMVGYMDGWSLDQPGNPFGVHIGWEGDSITLSGEKIISATEVELFELEIDLVIHESGTPEANWTYSVDLTDDDGGGNDSFGTGLRIAGWLGEPLEGHRHSADAFGSFAKGAPDSRTVNGSHGDVGSNGKGDILGIAISLRNANGTGGPLAFEEFEDEDGDVPGPIYVDRIFWTGGLTIDGVEPTSKGTVPLADLDGNGSVQFADFLILRDNFNLSGTNRSTGDLNGDQFTGLRDFALFREAFAAGAAGVAAVPEPSSVTLLVLGCLALVNRRRRRNR